MVSSDDQSDSDIGKPFHHYLSTVDKSKKALRGEVHPQKKIASLPEGIGYWGRLQLGLSINTFGAKEKKKGRICLKTKLGQHIECSAIDSVSLKDEPYCHFLSHFFFNKRRRRIPRKKKKSSSTLEERQTSSNFLTDHIQGAKH